jgi:hypothetical protein
LEPLALSLGDGAAPSIRRATSSSHGASKPSKAASWLGHARSTSPGAAGASCDICSNENFCESR